jgi:ABC-type Fe3+/spermidine/putrescine transport system ATPase subunit
MTGLRFQGITRQFGARRAVDGVDLMIRPGEFFSLLGPSGSGKSTLLRIAAGLEHPDAGRVMLGDRDITGLPPQQRGIGLVFQNYALFPQMTVAENVSFGLRLRKIPPHEIATRTDEALARVALVERKHAHVASLSGGEQQRVAVARALVIEPDILLFDEPLSNLDVTLRQRTRAEIRTLQKRTRITTLYVTHDQAEALSISDRVAVIHEGKVEQVGLPSELYFEPATAFVAGFLGWENRLEGIVTPGEQTVKLKELPIDLPGTFAGMSGDPVHVMLLPEMVHVVPGVHKAQLTGTVESFEFRGASVVLSLRLGDVVVHASVTGDQAHLLWSEGQQVGMNIDWESARVFPKITS